MTKYSVDQRREIMTAANDRGLNVRGNDGTLKHGTVCGCRNDMASVHVRLPFGDVSIEYGWGTIERATAGSGELRA